MAPKARRRCLRRIPAGGYFQDTVAVAAADAKFQRNAEAAFVDDTWKVTPKLTLSLGLRYELVPPFTDQINNLFTVYVPHIYHTAGAPQSDWPYFVRQGNCQDAYTANPPIPIRWDANPAIVTPAVCSNGLLPDALMKTRYKDFAPRFGHRLFARFQDRDSHRLRNLLQPG